MDISKSNRGALAEYRVAIFLLASGSWLIFRSMTPNGAVDMVVQHRRSGHLFKCQVKSASGTTATAGNPKHLRQGRNDILAVVGPDSILFKVRNRQIQRLLPGSILARPLKRPVK